MKSIVRWLIAVALLVPLTVSAQGIPPGARLGGGGGGGSGGASSSAPLSGAGTVGSPITLPTTANVQINSLGVGIAADGTSGDILLPNASAIKQLDSGAVARNLIGLDGSNNTNVGNPAIGGTIINGASTVNGPLGISSTLTLNSNTLGLKQKDSGGTARNILNLGNTNILDVGTATNIVSINNNSPVTYPTYTVATLPATCTKNWVVEVTDATTINPAGGTCTGGGSSAIPVVCSATNTWSCL